MSRSIAKTDPAPSGERTRRVAGAAILGLLPLLVLTVLAVAPSLDGAFTFDEQVGIAANRAVQPGAPWRGALAYRFSPDQSRPLFFLSLWLDAQTRGMAPRGFRVTNLTLHLMCGLVVAFLLRRAVSRLPAPPPVSAGAALAGTALFLLHPLQAESVIYIWGRSGILTTLFALAALAVAPAPGDAPRTSPAHGGRVVPRPLAWIAAWGLLALALAAKEEAIVLPLVALIWWIGVEARPPRPALRHALVFALPVVLFVLARFAFLGSVGRKLYVRSVPDNLLGQGVVSLKMALLTLWPAGLSIDHAVRVPAAMTGLPAIVICAGLAAAALVGLRRPPGAPLRLACAGALVYSAGLLLYWLVPIPDLMSERRSYLPLFGAAIAVTGLCVPLAGRLAAAAGAQGGRLRAALLSLLPAAAISAALWPALHARSRLWAEPALLWEEASRQHPERARPHINLGVIAAERGDHRAAAGHLDRAVALEPGNPEALYNRGRLHLEDGDVAGAVSDLRGSVAQDPTVPRAHINLAIALIRAGDLGAAEEELHAALAIDPGDPRALTNLAEVLRGTGRATEAVPLYRQALANDPGYAHAAARLGVTLEDAGDRRGALEAYREYLRRGAATDADAQAVRARIAALEAALATPGSIR